jgi:tRNA-modifying protein YgfZ
MASVSGDMTGKIQAGAAWAPGLLHFRGSDCAKFLQGQLSNDMRSLSDAGWLLAGLHNPQGRVLALLRLLAPVPDHVVALLPAELADAIATTLRRYVLRAKVTISADRDTAALAQFAAQSPAATLPAAAGRWPAGPGRCYKNAGLPPGGIGGRPDPDNNAIHT